MAWRWDQGRLNYFRFEEISRIAKGLVQLDGQPLPRADEPDRLRQILSTVSAQPFAPAHYTVWRNYGRVFGCQMLAAKVDAIMVCTELCHQLAQDAISPDAYLHHIATHFYYPSPIFEGYNTRERQVFPACAIIKLLASRHITGGNASVTIDDVAGILAGNGVSGTEDLDHYGGLRDSGHRFRGDELRQVRELVVFFSQLAFLKWGNQRLYLDISSSSEAHSIAVAFTPSVTERRRHAHEELIALGGAVYEEPEIEAQIANLDVEDQAFVEGRRTRITHYRVERSRQLRQLYYARIQNPQVCNMCELDTIIKYPWTGGIVELHHLLPLASPLRAENSATSLEDLVGVCPSCHRAVHRYYSQWLREQRLQDFSGIEQARGVYELAKEAIVA